MRITHKKLKRNRFEVFHFDEMFIFRDTKKNNTLYFHFSNKKIVIAALLLVTCITSASFVVYNRNNLFNFADKNDLALNDDEKYKNDLLLSSQTEYTEPDKDRKLKFETYTIKKGDTLGEIAKEFGVSTDTICGSNALSSYDFIKEGKILRIPNKEGILYKIKKSDTLDSISKKYSTDKTKILTENPELSGIQLSQGTEIFIPDAKPKNMVSGFIWPTVSKRITSGFGMRTNPIAGGRHFHSGLDIKSNYQPIRASQYGKITYVGWLGEYGKAIIISHPGGYKTLYGHLSRFQVKSGQYVKQGQVIARSGTTGSSTGPHLHFEIIYKGKYLNPYKSLRR